ERGSGALGTWGDDEAGDEEGEPLGVPAVSDRESLVGQDFATFAPDQLDEVLRLTVLIARRLARRISRRRRPVRRRGRVDLRRTLRANLTRADLIDLRFRARKPTKTKLVLLCDVSGSMDLYWRFLLLANTSYEPLTRGTAAPLPLVDHFAPAHNLASLRDLAQRLTL